MKMKKINYSRYIRVGLCGSCPAKDACDSFMEEEECLYVICSYRDFIRYAPYVFRGEFVRWLRERAIELGVNPVTALRAFRKSYRTVNRMVAVCN